MLLCISDWVTEQAFLYDSVMSRWLCIINMTLQFTICQSVWTKTMARTHKHSQACFELQCTSFWRFFLGQQRWKQLRQLHNLFLSEIRYYTRNNKAVTWFYINQELIGLWKLLCTWNESVCYKLFCLNSYLIGESFTFTSETCFQVNVNISCLHT